MLTLLPFVRLEGVSQKSDVAFSSKSLLYCIPLVRPFHACCCVPLHLAIVILGDYFRCVAFFGRKQRSCKYIYAM